jgi:hypothetical protein
MYPYAANAGLEALLLDEGLLEDAKRGLDGVWGDETAPPGRGICGTDPIIGKGKCPKYGFMGPIPMKGDASIGVIGMVPMDWILGVDDSWTAGWAVFARFAEEPPSSSLLSAPAAVVILPATITPTLILLIHQSNKWRP